MFKVGDSVKIEKWHASNSPEFRTMSEDEYKHGSYDNKGSPPKGYWVTGRLATEPKQGERLLLYRDCRNGNVVNGIFQTSQIVNITSVDENNFRLETVNSVYLVTNYE